MIYRHISVALLLSTFTVQACSKPVTPIYSKKSAADVDSANGNPSTDGEPEEETPVGGEGEGDEVDPITPVPSTSPTHASSSPSTPTSTPSPSSMPSTVGMTPSPTPIPAPNPAPTPAPVSNLATGNVSLKLTYVKPSTNGTHYTRGHVRVVFITRDDGAKDTYVRTLESFGKVRSINLKRWLYLNGGDYSIDGVTQATKAYVANGLKDPNASLTWDLKDTNGVVQPLGKYKMWFELATGNTEELDNTKITQSQNIGNGYAFHIVPFELTASGTTVQDSKSPVFTAIQLVHTK